jgi:hypothetical protein
MNIRKWSATSLVLAAFVLSAFAQDGAIDTVFAPFPSRIRTALKDNTIVVSWQDSPDLKSGYLVYRSETAIDANSLPSAKRLGSITMGAQSYTDTPPDSKYYFYAVLAQAEDGSPYQVFIPAKNTTTVGIALPPPKAPAAPVAAPAAPPAAPLAQAASASVAPFVSGIEAKAKGDAIVISYKASPKSRLVLYRGAAPIVQASDLLDATLVAAFSDKNGNFTDYPVPGVEYYYAILGEEDLKAGKISLALGVNALASSVQVRAQAVSSGFVETTPASRTPPLPYFLLENDGIGNAALASIDEGLPPPRAVSPETGKAIAVLLAKAPQTKKDIPVARALPEESKAPAGGEDYALSLIAGDKIASKDWAGAVDQLRKYLSLNRSPRTAARARFYLGEALASTGVMQDAFFEFISARDFYPIETKPWIDYVLSALAKD